MQLSKAGVLSDEPVKENDDSDSFMDDEPATPENHLPALQTDSEQLTHANEVMISAEEVREEDETKVREEDETMFKNLQTTRRDDDEEEEGLQRMVSQFFENSAMMCVFGLFSF